MDQKESQSKNIAQSKKWLRLQEAGSYLAEAYNSKADEMNVLHFVSTGRVDGYFHINREICFDVLDIERAVFCGRGIFSGFVPITARDSIQIEINSRAKIGVAKNAYNIRGEAISKIEHMQFDEKYGITEESLKAIPERFEFYMDEEVWVGMSDIIIETASLLNSFQEYCGVEIAATSRSLASKKRISVGIDGDEVDIKRKNSYLRVIYALTAALTAALIKGCTGEPYKDSAAAVRALESSKNVPISPITDRALGDYLSEAKPLYDSMVKKSTESKK